MAVRVRTPTVQVSAAHGHLLLLRQYFSFAKDPDGDRVTLKPGKSAYADLARTHAGPSAKAKYLQVSTTGGNGVGRAGRSWGRHRLGAAGQFRAPATSVRYQPRVASSVASSGVGRWPKDRSNAEESTICGSVCW